MKKKYALFIGRWQTWHAGHEWLIRQQLDKGKNVWLAIRDVDIDKDNLFLYLQVYYHLIIKANFISCNYFNKKFAFVLTKRYTLDVGFEKLINV